MRILVTGGAGFIGSHVVPVLIEEGHEVTVVDDLSTGRTDNVAPPAEFTELDVRAPLDDLFAQMRPEVVVHLAAQVSASRANMDPAYDLAVNVGGTVNVVATAANAGVRKVIFVSSAAVYGDSEQLPIGEETPLAPLSPYGLSKMAAERYVQMLCGLRGIDYTIIRPANVYGPRQVALGEGAVIPSLLNHFLSEEDPLIQGDGEQTRDFIYVSDLADAMAKAIDRGGGQTINISSGKACTINTLWRMLAGLTGWQRPPAHSAPRSRDIHQSLLDNSRAGDVLHWTPRTPIADGLRATVEWYLEAKANGWVNRRFDNRAVAT